MNDRGLGVYHCFIGMATLPASLLMGLIWKAIGVQWAFSFGAGMALIAALLALILMGKPTKNSNNQIPTCGRQAKLQINSPACRHPGTTQ